MGHCHDPADGHTRTRLTSWDLLRGVQTKSLPAMTNALGVLATHNWMPVDMAKGHASLNLLARLGHCYDVQSAAYLQKGVTTGTSAENDQLLTSFFHDIKSQIQARRRE